MEDEASTSLPGDEIEPLGVRVADARSVAVEQLDEGGRQSYDTDNVGLAPTLRPDPGRPGVYLWNNGTRSISNATSLVIRVINL